MSIILVVQKSYVAIVFSFELPFMETPKMFWNTSNYFNFRTLQILLISEPHKFFLKWSKTIQIIFEISAFVWFRNTKI